MKPMNSWATVIFFSTLFAGAISSHADPAAVGAAAAAICSGSQDVDLESTTGNAKYKDLKVEITDAGKTLKLKFKGALLAQITDFTYEKYQGCVQTMMKALGEVDKQSGIDLRWLDVGARRDFLMSKLGQPKSVGTREILEDDSVLPFKWKTVPVDFYEFLGASIRVTYDDNNSASSIFIGPAAEPKAVKLNNVDSWPTRWRNAEGSPGEIAWPKLHFSDVGNETCDQEVHTGASAGLVAIVCSYTYIPPGGSTYDQLQCFMSAGASDGAFNVELVEDQADISEMQMADLKEEKHWSDEQAQKWVWQQIKDKAFNYMMKTCDRSLILYSW